MRSQFITAVTLLLICSFTINAQTLDPVAVIDFSGEGLSQSSLIALSDVFRAELIASGLYNVMNRKNMDVILIEQAFQHSGACTDLNCMVDMGQILCVSKMFGGSIGKLGSKYIITIKIIDIETSRIEELIIENYFGNIENLNIPIKNLANKITGQDIRKNSTKFYITSFPDSAKVYVNEIFIGNTPIETQLHEIKTYNIRIDKRGYQPWIVLRKAREGETELINALLNSVIDTDPLYLKEKKSIRDGMLYSIFPGGGHFYSRQYILGGFFFISRIVLFGAQVDSKQNETIVLSSIVFAFPDIITVPLSVNSYNKKLKQKYNISMYPIMDREQNCQLAFTIDF